MTEAEIIVENLRNLQDQFIGADEIVATLAEAIELIQRQEQQIEGLGNDLREAT